jgi:hypothetical protein
MDTTAPGAGVAMALWWKEQAGASVSIDDNHTARG